jgi:hypothetical protein
MFDVSVVAALGAAALFLRWLLSSRAAGAAFPAISVGSCAVIAVVATLPVVVRANLDARLGSAASKLIGIPVKVNCQTLTGSALDLGNELGWVAWGPDGRPEHKTLIKQAQCNDLQAYLDSNKQHPSDAQVQAVHVLTHESMHMAGNKSEAVAECYATQHDTEMAELLGASPDDARQLAVRYWRLFYPRMPDAYTSGDCRPGGSLDLHLATPAWSVSSA